MRGLLWNALRHHDSDLAASEFASELARVGGQDPHLVLAGLELARLGGIDPVAFCSVQEPGDLGSLQEVAARYLRHDWPGVVEARASRRLKVGPEGELEALFDCLAIQAAESLGDSYLACSLAREALEAWPRFPLILYLALKIDLYAPFLDCPDLLLLDLAEEIEKPENDRYLETAWPAVSQAISAWFHHRDERRTYAQSCITAFSKASDGCPLDVILAAPFLKKIDPGLVAQFLDLHVPYRTSPGIETHLRFNQLSAEKRAAVVEDALRSDADHPYFRCEAVRAMENVGTRDEYLESLAELREGLPWYQVVLRQSLYASLAESDHAGTLLLAAELLARSASFSEMYDWVVSCIREKRDVRLLADFVLLALRNSRWSVTVGGVRENEALYHLANAGKHQEVGELLNRLTEFGDIVELAEGLRSREVRLALESMPSPDGLTARALVASTLLSLYFGAFPLGQEFLSRLNALGAEELGATCEWLELLEDLLKIAPQLREGEVRADVLARALEVFARVGRLNDMISLVRFQVLRMRERGQFHEARVFLHTAIEAYPAPELLAIAAAALSAELKDPAEALALLDRWSELGACEPGVWLVRCEVLDELGRVDDWLKLARQGNSRFPDRSASFVVEEGLALAIQGEAAGAVDRLSEGLAEDLTNERGIKGFMPLAVRFEAQERLFAILSGAVEQEPENGEIRDYLLSILSSIESHQRERVFHLFRRAYREREADEARRKSLRDTLAILRHRLLVRDGVVGSGLTAFADVNRRKVSSVVTEAQAVLFGSILACVFTEFSVSSQGPEGNAKLPEVESGLLVLGDWKRISEWEREPSKEGLRTLLSESGYQERVEIADVQELWQSLRRADQSMLHRLLEGVPVEDSSFLGALRLLRRHCELFVERFEKYVVCYAVAGSFVRVSQRIGSDIDLWVVIDDSSLNKQTREQLKLEETHASLAKQARAEQAAPRQLHIQIRFLSAFWRSLQTADPINLSMLRDGVPLYDRGLFNAWFNLLEEGKLSSTRESLDAQVAVVQALHDQTGRTVQALARDLMDPIKYGTVKMLEVLLQVLELPVGHYREVVGMAHLELVQRRAVLNEEDLEIARKGIEYYKAIEAGTVPRVEEGLALYRRVEDFYQKARSLYHQLMSDRQRSQIEEVVLRIESVLEKAGSHSEGKEYWRRRLGSFRDEAQQLLMTREGGGLEALRMTQLAERISEIAPGLALFEAAEESLGKATGATE